jgi:hypothetical protein
MGCSVGKFFELVFIGKDVRAIVGRVVQGEEGCLGVGILVDLFHGFKLVARTEK